MGDPEIATPRCNAGTDTLKERFMKKYRMFFNDSSISGFICLHLAYLWSEVMETNIWLKITFSNVMYDNLFEHNDECFEMVRIQEKLFVF